MLDYVEFLVRIGIALVLGGAIGLERERDHKAAGFRTHILVVIGSCLLTSVMISTFGITDALSRGIQGLVTGIGFLGAGQIVFSERERMVHGLTTAASVWVAAVVGIAVGMGHYFISTITTIIVILVLMFHDWDYFRKPNKQTTKK